MNNRSFKCTFTQLPQKEAEIRRFSLAQPEYSSLLQTLSALLPPSQVCSSLTWVDQEKDQISVKNQLDFEEMLKQQSHDPVRMNVFHEENREAEGQRQKTPISKPEPQTLSSMIQSCVLKKTQPTKKPTQRDFFSEMLKRKFSACQASEPEDPPSVPLQQTPISPPPASSYPKIEQATQDTSQKTPSTSPPTRGQLLQDIKKGVVLKKVPAKKRLHKCQPEEEEGSLFQGYAQKMNVLDKFGLRIEFYEDINESKIKALMRNRLELLPAVRQLVYEYYNIVI